MWGQAWCQARGQAWGRAWALTPGLFAADSGGNFTRRSPRWSIRRWSSRRGTHVGRLAAGRGARFSSRSSRPSSWPPPRDCTCGSRLASIRGSSSGCTSDRAGGSASPTGCSGHVIAGGILIGDEHSPLAIVLPSVAVGAVVAFLLIEPVTTRDAFKRSGIETSVGSARGRGARRAARAAGAAQKFQERPTAGRMNQPPCAPWSRRPGTRSTLPARRIRPSTPTIGCTS